MTSRSDRAQRRTLLLVLLLLVGSLGARALHWIATPHRLCEVHGTLEHELVAAQESAPATPASGPVYRPEGRAHEECALGPFLRGEVLPLAETRCVASFARVVRVGERPPERLPEQTRFGLAPSRSPPV